MLGRTLLRRSGEGPGGASVASGALLDPLPESPWLRRSTNRQPNPLVLGILASGVAVAALVNPKLPGHSGPVDVIMLAGIFAVGLWALRTRAIVRLPFAVAMAGLMITGLMAGLFSAYPTDGLTAVTQEIFLLLWCGSVATVCRTPWALGVVLRTWVASAVAWAVLLIATELLHLHSVAGQPLVGRSGATGGTRAQLFFDQPNMAGNYFMIAVFLLIASGWPRRVWVRVGACLILLTAQFLTGSNAALLSLIVGGVLTLFLQLRTKHGLVKAIAFTTAMAAVLGAGAITVVPTVVSYAQSSNNSLLQNSVGRSARSAVARQSLFAWQFKLYEEGDLIGIGPNGTQQALGAQAAPAVKEAHNDYLGTLVERGPFGLAALALLLATVISRVVRFSGRQPPARLRSVLPVPGALTGACVAFAVTAFTHEILHYRWLFTLLGLVAAVQLLTDQTGAKKGRPAAGKGSERQVVGLPTPRRVN